MFVIGTFVYCPMPLEIAISHCWEEYDEMTKEGMIFSSPSFDVPKLKNQDGALAPALILESLPSRRRKRDMPEAWCGCGEFHRDEIALLMFNGGPRHPAALLLRSALVD